MNGAIVWAMKVLLYKTSIFQVHFGYDQVPVTNFFFSVMKTIHTDSAYTGFTVAPKIEAEVVLEENDDERRAFQSDVDSEKTNKQDM